MPMIIVEGPPLADVDRKRKLVAEMSASAAAAYNIPVEAMVVIIKESPPENVGLGGRLIVDRRR